MRAEGIAVGLEPQTRAGRIAARVRPARLEGVRLYTSSDGEEILVGRTGRDNDRLTFRLAGQDDFWLHASGTAGAHVILRNPRRQPRPSPMALQEAAALAAWWSDVRAAGQVDVQWTRRKHVHRIRGAAPGTVRVKKSETILVRPAVPAATQGETGG
jgi:predicted ribosome quality control (RQC) complex YloA/Tae2 family protein